MDILTITGLFLAFFSLIVGAILKGAGVKGLLGGAAFVIVVLGTIASICIHAPMHSVKRALAMMKWLFKPPKEDQEALVKRLVEWSSAARRRGVLALEPEIAKEQDPFIKRGLELVYDGAAPDTVRKVLEVESDARYDMDYAGAKVFEGMGIYAPTLGIIGAVLGLMAVMQNLEDPSKLGTGIAAAFTATVYGIGIANLFLLPAAAKLKEVSGAQARTRGMIIDGLAAIAEGENPRIIEAKLQGYLTKP
ncbi:MAG: flagellar motor protein [Gammaproteobacteria bacterium]|nr:flagellar motor protein [Gammaproteobacteria bacterium]